MSKHKQLEKLQQQRQKLQDKEKEIQESMLIEVGQVLMRSGALSIDYFTLVGGILSVVETAHKGENSVKEWQEKGKRFCHVRLNRKPKPKMLPAT